MGTLLWLAQAAELGLREGRGGAGWAGAAAKEVARTARIKALPAVGRVAARSQVQLAGCQVVVSQGSYCTKTVGARLTHWTRY